MIYYGDKNETTNETNSYDYNQNSLKITTFACDSEYYYIVYSII